MRTKKEQVSSGMVGMQDFKTLEEAEATRKFNRFKSDTVEEYEKSLKYMTECDLYNHAVSLGIRPSSERSEISRTLIKIFKETEAIVKKTKRPQAARQPEIIGGGATFEDFMRKNF